jgi:hypothetical protein
MSSIVDMKRMSSLERDVKSLQEHVDSLIELNRGLLERMEALELKRGPGRPRKEDAGFREAASGD